MEIKRKRGRPSREEVAARTAAAPIIALEQRELEVKRNGRDRLARPYERGSQHVEGQKFLGLIYVGTMPIEVYGKDESAFARIAYVSED